MQAAEGPRHAPDHLQGQAVELGQLVEEQRVHGPVGREQEGSEKVTLRVSE